MSQNVVKAEPTQKEKGAVGGSWHVQDTEVIFKTRKNRSSRPEVVYHYFINVKTLTYPRPRKTGEFSFRG